MNWIKVTKRNVSRIWLHATEHQLPVVQKGFTYTNYDNNNNNNNNNSNNNNNNNVGHV